MAEPEVGICTIDLTEAGRVDPLFAGLGPTLDCLQWHGAEVSALPEAGVVLATNPACAVQAFRAGDAAYGLQFHSELTAATVPGWGEIPTYRQDLERVMGAGAQERLEKRRSGAHVRIQPFGPRPLRQFSLHRAWRSHVNGVKKISPDGRAADCAQGWAWIVWVQLCN